MLITILLFDGVTALDAVGPYEALQRLPDVTIRFVAGRAGPVRTGSGFLGLHADQPLASVDRSDVLIVPGGSGEAVRAAMGDKALLGWIAAVDATTRCTASVCTGALILAAAGLLRGRPASTHWRGRQALPALGATVSTARVTRSGKYLTSGGVSAGIDMALRLCSDLAGTALAEAVELSMDYAPEPPFGTGDPATATAERIRLVEEVLRN